MSSCQFDLFGEAQLQTRIVIFQFFECPFPDFLVVAIQIFHPLLDLFFRDFQGADFFIEEGRRLRVIDQSQHRSNPDDGNRRMEVIPERFQFDPINFRIGLHRRGDGE